MQAIPRLLVIGVLGLVVSGGILAQTASTLQPLVVVEDQIEPGQSQSWSFTGWEGAMWSFVVEAESPDFDPVLTLRNSAGVELIRNDDYDYPQKRDAALEGISIPKFDDYTATITAVGDSSGAYRLTMLPGYAEVAISENFSGDNVWRRQDDALELSIGEGQLNLSLAGINQTAAAINPDSPTLLNFYTQVHVTAITSTNNWNVGLILRQEDAANYYLLAINQSGFWRLTQQTTGGLRVVQDWTTHPAIMAGKTDFTLGVLANDRMFELFYDGQYIGQVLDSRPASAGQIGLAVSTANAFGSQTQAYFDDLMATVPATVNGQAIWPEQIMRDNQTVVLQELQRRHLIPVDSRLVLTVPESFAQSLSPGVQRYNLGRGETYDNFAMMTQVTWNILGEGAAGCGLTLRSVDDTFYTLAFVDQTGGYGLAQRDGDQFLPGLFGTLDTSEAGTRQMLVIANGDMLHYYLDGRYRGSVASEEVAGAIGNAVVNFEPLDTTCQFANTWLWRWD